MEVESRVEWSGEKSRRDGPDVDGSFGGWFEWVCVSDERLRTQREEGREEEAVNIGGRMGQASVQACTLPSAEQDPLGLDTLRSQRPGR